MCLINGLAWRQVAGLILILLTSYSALTGSIIFVPFDATGLAHIYKNGSI